MEIIKVSVGSAVRLGAQSPNGLLFRSFRLAHALVIRVLVHPVPRFLPFRSSYSYSLTLRPIDFSFTRCNLLLTLQSASSYFLRRYLAVVPRINAFHSVDARSCKPPRRFVLPFRISLPYVRSN